MTADYDIIIFALPRWDGLYSSTAWSLAKELSLYTRVFYIDNPFTFKDYFLHRDSPQIRKRKNALRYGRDFFSSPETGLKNLFVITPPLVFPINWLPPGKMYERLSAKNDRIVFDVIEKMMQEFSIRKYVYINSFNPLYGKYFPNAFRPTLTVYHCVDDITKSVYISRHGSYREKEVLQKSDVTLVTSQELRRLKEGQARETYYVPNAADVELFQQSLSHDFPRPVELKDIPTGKKVIFYMGNICYRIDYELVKKIALEMPEHFVVMVGPRTNDSYKKTGLDTLLNVIFTGRKDLRELPAYVKYSDCCIIPFQCNTLTKSIYPLKINEYLSAGKPVVTTNFSPDIATFEGVAFVSSTHEEFISNIRVALSGDSEAKRQQRVSYAAANSWRARAVDLLRIFGSKIDHHGK